MQSCHTLNNAGVGSMLPRQTKPVVCLGNIQISAGKPPISIRRAVTISIAEIETEKTIGNYQK